MDMNKDSSRKPMRNGCFLLGVVAFCCTPLLACTSGTETLDPDKLPYTLEEVFWESKFYPADLDGDGRDERVRVSRNVPSREHDALILRQFDGQLIGSELGYSEQAEIVGDPHFLDLDSDGVLEVLLSIVRNDSLFLSIVDGQTAQEREQIFLTNGAPQPQGGGFIPWDPKVRAIFREDIDGDGVYELVTVISTGYVPRPRGVFIHSLDDGRLLDDHLIGADPVPDIFFGDFDGDDQWEVVFATGAPNNGGNEGDLDDRHSYLVAVNLTLPMTEKWKKEKGSLKTNMHLFMKDLDSDGEFEFLAYKDAQQGRREPTVLELINPSTGNPYQIQPMDESVLDVEIVKLDHDTPVRILVLGFSGTVYVLNGELEIVRHLPLDVPGDLQKNALWVVPDADGDGLDEIGVWTSRETLFLSAGLRVKAIAPPGQLPQGTFHSGLNEPPLLLTWNPREDQTYVYRLARNHLYLLNRYGPPLVWIVGVGLWLVAGFLIVSFYRKNRQLVEAIRNNIRKYTGQAEENFIDRAYEVVSNHYGDSRFNVRAFAGEMECSPRTLQRDLQAKVGCSPSEFIRTFRLERAKKLLADSELSIKEITYMVGFEHPESFSTTFKKDERVSPSEYRKNISSSSSSKSL